MEKSQKRGFIRIIPALSLLLAAIISALLLSGCGGAGGKNEPVFVYYVGQNSAESDGEGEPAGLTIPFSDITANAGFYGVCLEDGTYLEIIAVKYGGEYRTAFNTCQVCYGSAKAYFVQSGNYLVCQNCRNKFSMAQVGITSGSCNPYPISSDERADTEDSLVIPDEFLEQSKTIFKNWTGGY